MLIFWQRKVYLCDRQQMATKTGETQNPEDYKNFASPF